MGSSPEHFGCARAFEGAHSEKVAVCGQVYPVAHNASVFMMKNLSTGQAETMFSERDVSTENRTAESRCAMLPSTRDKKCTHTKVHLRDTPHLPPSLLSVNTVENAREPGRGIENEVFPTSKIGCGGTSKFLFGVAERFDLAA